MGKLVFVGLGLSSEFDLNLRAIKIIERAEKVFLEDYTNIAPNLDEEKFKEITGKKIIRLNRSDIENDNSEKIFEIAKEKIAVFLVIGDPMVSTTHAEIRIEAKKRGIETLIIHNTSIISAICGATGLQNYKFGKNTSIPFFEKHYKPSTPYKIIKQNLDNDLHTLLFLDIKPERLMDIKAAIDILRQLENKLQYNIISDGTLLVGAARVGCDNSSVQCDYLSKLSKYDFGPTPHTLIVPASLHPIEAEYLQLFANAPKKINI